MRIHRAAAAVMSGVLVAGLLAQVPLAHADPAEPAGMAKVLLGSYMRTVDQDPEYARDLVTTAEVLDWRARHPAADQNALTAHTNAVQQTIVDKVPDDLWYQGLDEIIGATVNAVRLAPGVTSDGPNLGRVSAAFNGKDAKPLSGNIKDRLRGSVQLNAWSTAVYDAAAAVWASLSATAQADATFAGAWNASVGSKVSVNAAATGLQLAASPQLNQAFNFTEIIPLLDEPEALQLATSRKFADMAEAIRKQRTGLFGDLKVAVDNQRSAGTRLSSTSRPTAVRGSASTTRARSAAPSGGPPRMSAWTTANP